MFCLGGDRGVFNICYLKQGIRLIQASPKRKVEVFSVKARFLTKKELFRKKLTLFLGFFFKKKRTFFTKKTVVRINVFDWYFVMEN